MNLPPPLLVPLTIVGAVCFWCFVAWAISRVGGWHALATRFPAGPNKPYGLRMFYMEQLELGAAYYKGCAIVGVAPAGLYLSVFKMFGVGHAPVLVPWAAITRIKTEKQWWMTRYELSVPLQKFDTATITLFNGTLIAAITPHLTLLNEGGLSQ